MKMIFIDPWCNFTAATWGDKWIAPRPGTDAAMAEAIAYVWIKDDTYDHWFIENKTIGFEEFKTHILGGKGRFCPYSGMGGKDLRDSGKGYLGSGQTSGHRKRPCLPPARSMA